MISKVNVNSIYIISKNESVFPVMLELLHNIKPQVIIIVHGILLVIQLD